MVTSVSSHHALLGKVCSTLSIFRTAESSREVVVVGNTHYASVIGQIDLKASDTWLAILDIQRITSQWSKKGERLSQP